MSEMIDDNMGLEFQAWLAEAPGEASIGEGESVVDTPCKSLVLTSFSSDGSQKATEWLRTVNPKVVAIDSSTETAAVKLLDCPDPFAFSFVVFKMCWPGLADLLVSKAGQEWRSDGQ